MEIPELTNDPILVNALAEDYKNLRKITLEGYEFSVQDAKDVLKDAEETLANFLKEEECEHVFMARIEVHDEIEYISGECTKCKQYHAKYR